MQKNIFFGRWEPDLNYIYGLIFKEAVRGVKEAAQSTWTENVFVSRVQF